MSFLHYLIPSQTGIPILVYHHILPAEANVMNTPPDLFEQQLTFLKSEGYWTVSLALLLKIVSGEVPKPEKAIHITFDDGYLSQVQNAYPLLKKYGFKSSIYIIGNCLKENRDLIINPKEDDYADCNELRNLDPEIMEIGLHSSTHRPFSDITTSDMQMEIVENMKLFNQFKLPFQPFFAYPYGSRPQRKQQLTEMKASFKSLGLKIAFRVGNKIQKIPASDLFEVKRIHMSGLDSIADLKIKLKKGKLKPF